MSGGRRGWHPGLSLVSVSYPSEAVTGIEGTRGIVIQEVLLKFLPVRFCAWIW